MTLIELTIAVKNPSGRSFSQASQISYIWVEKLIPRNEESALHPPFQGNTHAIYQYLIPSSDHRHLFARRTFLTGFARKKDLQSRHYSTTCQSSSAPLTHRLECTRSRTIDPMSGLETDMSILIRPGPPKPVAKRMISL